MQTLLGETMANDEMKLMPLERPALIDAIRCRLEQDVEIMRGAAVPVPAEELKMILEILEAARQCVSEWQPRPSEKARGCGTGVGMRAAEDRLIEIMRR